MKAKIISETDYSILESRLNEFLKEIKDNAWRLLDIKYDLANAYQLLGSNWQIEHFNVFHLKLKICHIFRLIGAR